MASFSYSPDIKQGYDFKADKRLVVGFINSIKIATETIEADQELAVPLSSDKVKVVAVLSHFAWEGGATDGLYFDGQVSISNAQKLEALTKATLDKIEVTVKFTIYKYDPKASAYFKCFHSNDADIKCILEKTGASGDLSLGVAGEQSTEVPSPMNYAMTIGLKPDETAAATLHWATSTGYKGTQTFGRKAG